MTVRAPRLWPWLALFSLGGCAAADLPQASLPGRAVYIGAEHQPMAVVEKPSNALANVQLYRAEQTPQVFWFLSGVEWFADPGDTVAASRTSTYIREIALGARTATGPDGRKVTLPGASYRAWNYDYAREFVYFARPGDGGRLPAPPPPPWPCAPWRDLSRVAVSWRIGECAAAARDPAVSPYGVRWVLDPASVVLWDARYVGLRDGVAEFTVRRRSNLDAPKATTATVRAPISGPFVVDTAEPAFRLQVMRADGQRLTYRFTTPVCPDPCIQE